MTDENPYRAIVLGLASLQRIWLHHYLHLNPDPGSATERDVLGTGGLKESKKWEWQRYSKTDWT
jgi:hypothetical protein